MTPPSTRATERDDSSDIAEPLGRVRRGEPSADVEVTRAGHSMIIRRPKTPYRLRTRRGDLPSKQSGEWLLTRTDLLGAREPGDTMVTVRPPRANPGRAGALLVALALGAGSLVACTSDPGSSTAGSSVAGSPSAAGSSSRPATSPSASASSSTKGSPAPSSSTGPAAPSASPTGSLGPPLANPAPSRISKVLRNGKTPNPTVVAPASQFSQPVTYSDGVRLRVVKAAKDIEEGHGAGTFAGRELVVLDLEIVNGTPKGMTLDQVVVTAFYGKDRQLAPTVYAPNVSFKDFGGSLAAGKSAPARYAFAIPAHELGAVTLVIDFDGVHASTVFTGKVSVS